MTYNLEELKAFLDSKVILYNTESYIESDPIQIPHRFIRKEDIEIAAFFALPLGQQPFKFYSFLTH